MRRLSVLGLIGAALMAGCFPIELEVASDGRVLIPRQEGFFALDAASGKVDLLYAPEKGKPVFGRFSPDGKKILAVTEGGSAMFGSGFDFAIVEGGKARSLFSLGNGTYALWSPDGAYVSATRQADSKKPPLDEAMPELHVAAVKDGAKKVLASNVSDLHRWFPDSKAVLVFEVDTKDTGDKLYRGKLARVNVATGESKPLVSVAGDKGVFFDLSPDGKTVLFTARGAAEPGAAVEPAKKDQLFELKLADGAVRSLGEGVKYALFSPNGKRVLLATDEKDGVVTLKVAAAGALDKATAIAGDAAASVGGGGMGGDTKIRAAWCGNDAVVYLTETAVYGTAGKNLALIHVGVDGKGAKNLQAAIDGAALKAAK